MEHLVASAPLWQAIERWRARRRLTWGDAAVALGFGDRRSLQAIPRQPTIRADRAERMLRAMAGLPHSPSDYETRLPRVFEHDEHTVATDCPYEPLVERRPGGGYFPSDSTVRKS